MTPPRAAGLPVTDDTRDPEVLRRLDEVTGHLADLADVLASHEDLGQVLQRSVDQVVMDSRAIIDQAIGVLIAQTGMTADRAFAELSRRSQNTNVKLREVAAQLVASQQAG